MTSDDLTIDQKLKPTIDVLSDPTKPNLALRNIAVSSTSSATDSMLRKRLVKLGFTNQVKSPGPFGRTPEPHPLPGLDQLKSLSSPKENQSRVNASSRTSRNLDWCEIVIITDDEGREGLMKAYTRTGDTGETGLYDGARLWKNDKRVEAYGAVDELNSQIGVVRALAGKGKVRDALTKVQNDLFKIGGDLATRDTGAKVPRISHTDVSALESMVDEVHEKLPALRRFILPGGTVVAAQLHVARSVCRRSERRAVALAREERVNPEVIIYLNRLSSLLFELARFVNRAGRVKEEEWRHD